MTKTYVITDAHGMWNLFSKALVWIEEDSGGDPHTVVFMGDNIDRGPQSRMIMDCLIHGPTAEGANWRILLGNHEIMMLVAAINKGEALEMWLGNGGDATLFNYQLDHGSGVGKSAQLDDEAWMEVLKFINDDMEHFHEDAHRVYVHAYVQDGKPLEDHSLDTLLWHRYQDYDIGGYGSRHVVHGHTPHKEAVLKLGRTNLDTGASFYGVLTVGVFDDDTPGGPVALVQIS